MKIFQREIASTCSGKLNPECPNFKTKKRLQAKKRFCPECPSPMTPVYSLDLRQVFAVVLLLAGAGYAWMHSGISVPTFATESAPVQKKDSGCAAMTEAVQTATFKNGVGFAAQRMYDNAMREFSTIAECNPEYPLLMMNLGACHLRLRNYVKAGEYLEAAVKQTPEDANVAYNRACLFALTGKYDDSVQALRLAIGHGFRDRRAMEEDEDLASLRDKPAFVTLMKEMQEK